MRSLRPTPLPAARVASRSARSLRRGSSSRARAAAECAPHREIQPPSLTSPSPTPRFLEQALLEQRLLEKLLFDKKRELAAYDVQLEEYLRLSTARAAAGAQPLLPAFAAQLGGGTAQRDALQRLLAAKRAELEAANAEVAQYSQLLAARGVVLPAPAPEAEAAEAEAEAEAEGASAALADSERVRVLEQMLAAEAARREEQVSMNEELLRINEEQVAANEALVLQLEAASAAAAAAAEAAAAEEAAAAAAAAAATAAEEAAAKAAAAAAAATAAAVPPPPPPPPPPPVAPLPVPASAAPSSTDNFSLLGKLLEGAASVGVIAVGLAGAVVPASTAAARAVSELVSSETQKKKSTAAKGKLGKK